MFSLNALVRAAWAAACQSLWTHKGRTSVAVLSMAWGMGIYEASVSIVNGFDEESRCMAEEVGGLSVGRVTLFPSQEELDTTSLLDWALRGVDENVGLSASFVSDPMILKGITPSCQPLDRLTLATGRLLTQEDLISRSQVCVVGALVAQRLQETGNQDEMLVDGHPFKVVGTLASKSELKGIFLSTFVRWKDSLVLIPFSAMLEVFPDSIQQWELLQKLDGLSKPLGILPVQEKSGWKWQTNQRVIEVFKRSLAQKRPAVRAFTVVCMIMACLGVINMMLAGMTERVLEIGVRRSVGASNREILFQFLMEALICGILGAVSGVILAEMTTGLVMHFTDLRRVTTPQTLLICALVGPIVGMLAGLVPAIRAATMDPIKALRVE